MTLHSYSFGLSGRVEYELDDQGNLIDIDGITVECETFATARRYIDGATVAPEHRDKQPQPVDVRAGVSVSPVPPLCKRDTAASPVGSARRAAVGEAGRGVPVLRCPFCYTTWPADNGRCYSCGYCEGC